MTPQRLTDVEPDARAPAAGARIVTVKRLLIAVKLAVTGGALFIAWHVVSRNAFMASLSHIDPVFFSVAVLVLIAQVVIAAYRWRLIVGALDPQSIVEVAPTSFVRSFYVAQLFGQVLPFLASDAIRVILLRNDGVKLGLSFESVLLDRICALMVLFAIALPSVMLSPIVTATDRLFLPLMAIVIIGLVSSALVLAIAGPLSRLFRESSAAGFVIKTILDTRRLLLGRQSGARLLVLYLVVHGCSIVALWILARGEDVGLGLVDAVAIVPLVLMVMTVPISITGWGVREGFVLALLSAAGIPSEKALLLSLSFGVALLLAALPGAAFWFLSRGAEQARDGEKIGPAPAPATPADNGNHPRLLPVARD